MRHTFASWAIAAGLPTFEIAVTMGTSLEQLSITYAHLLPDSADRARVTLDAYLVNRAGQKEAAAGLPVRGLPSRKR
jgi:integrase